MAIITKTEFDSLKPSDQKGVVREFLKKDLYSMCHFLGYSDVNHRTHDETIYCLESRHPRKLITVPRGSFKSSIGAITYPIWRLLQNPNLRILIDSEVYGNAVTYLRAIKNHYKSNEFQSVFGDLEGEVWQEGSIIVNTRTKNLKEPSITCGGVATTKVGQHYDIIIGDDYNSRDNSRTKERAQGVVDHFRYNLNILEPDGEYVIIGTRYSESDLIGFILLEILNQKQLSEGKFGGLLDER